MSVAYLDPPRYGRGTGHKVCSLCGQPGHQRNSPVHRAERHAAIPAPGSDETPAVAQLRAGDFQGRESTIPPKPLSYAERAVSRLPVLDDQERPKTRGDCKDGPRPCPWVSCSAHLYLDVSESGAIKINHPGKEPWELAETCALDVADGGPMILKDVGAIMNLTRERIRQVEERAIRKIRKVAPELAHAGSHTPELPSLDDRLGWR